MSSKNWMGIEGEAPPPLRLLEMIAGKWISQALYVAAELCLADALKDGPRSAAEVARAAGVSEDGLYRLLRALSAVGVVRELEGRRFALDDLGQFLRADLPGSLWGFARLTGVDAFWRAWGRLVDSVRTGEPGFDAEHGTSAFEYADRHPEFAAVVNDGMTSVSELEASQIVAAYDFTGIGTLVDVGGGHGLLLATILEANPTLRGVLLEMSHAVAGGRRLLADRGLADRAEAVAGSFLEHVPAADGCILKHIIHDWDDERSVKILANCRQAIPSRGKVLIVDVVLPAAGEPHFGKLLDLEMLVVTPRGRERTEDEFRSLLSAAGLRFSRVVPTGGFSSIVEAVKP